jgi:hypothetical protein
MGGNAALRHLVVVVPGFGGSVLTDASGAPRWGPGFSDIARGMVRADPLSVTDHPDLVVAGLLRTVTVFPPFVLPGYDRLVRQISDAFGRVRVDEVLPGRPRDPRADLVLFPYDFRHGVRPAALRLRAEIEARLSGLPSRDRRGRVIVVAHSMGGLVARYWLGPLGGWPDCRALITVATPHRGVPKALDWLVNGVHLGQVRLRAMTDVSRHWQGVYDLLPQYPAVLTVGLPAGSGAVPRRGQAAGPSRAVGPLEIGDVAAAGFLRRASDAAAMHAEIEQAWQQLSAGPGQPELSAVFARGHATPSRIVLADGKLTISRADPEWLPHAGSRGDGTVPAFSAVPPELTPLSGRPDAADGALRAVPERHLPMAGAPAIVELLRACDGQAPHPARPRPPSPWLGVAVDNVVPAGDPVPVATEVLGAPDGDASGMWVSVSSRAGRAASYRCSRIGRRWQAVLPGQPAGTYSIAVTAERVPGAGLLRCTDMLEVVAI